MTAVPEAFAVIAARTAITRSMRGLDHECRPHDPKLFPKNSKPGRGMCSYPGCSGQPVVDRIDPYTCRALCAHHGFEIGALRGKWEVGGCRSSSQIADEGMTTGPDAYKPGDPSNPVNAVRDAK